MEEEQNAVTLEQDWDTFCAIEAEVEGAEAGGIEARWRCGRLLLRYESGGGRRGSPLAAAVRRLSSEFGVDDRELYYRRQFAEEYAEVCTAVQTFKSWTSLRDSLGKRGTRTRTRKAPEFPPGTFGLVYADPPWRYDFSETDSRQIENQYDTLEVDEIAAMEIPAAPDSVLYLWATAPKLREALSVMLAWKFEYLSNAVWVKDRIGMGYWFRGRHELLLVGKRGEFSPPEPEDRPDSVIEAPRGEHSAKPPIVYDMLERLYPDTPRIELFAREEREGWANWGNELD